MHHVLCEHRLPLHIGRPLFIWAFAETCYLAHLPFRYFVDCDLETSRSPVVSFEINEIPSLRCSVKTQISSVQIVMPLQVTRTCVFAHDHHCQKQFPKHLRCRWVLVPAQIVDLQNVVQAVANKVNQNAVHLHSLLPIVLYLLLADCMHTRQMDADRCVPIPFIPVLLLWMKAFPFLFVNFEKPFHTHVVIFQLEAISPSASPDPRHAIPGSVTILQIEHDFVSFGQLLLSRSTLGFRKELARRFHYAEGWDRHHEAPEIVLWSLLSTLGQSDQIRFAVCTGDFFPHWIKATKEVGSYREWCLLRLSLTSSSNLSLLLWMEMSNTLVIWALTIWLWAITSAIFEYVNTSSKESAFSHKKLETSQREIKHAEARGKTKHAGRTASLHANDPFHLTDSL